MELKVHCPHCHATLMVPFAAAGKAARCPACHEAFHIPTEEEIAEQTASAWIEQDIGEMANEDDQYWQDRLKKEADHKIREEEAKRQETAREIEKVLSSTRVLPDVVMPPSLTAPLDASPEAPPEVPPAFSSESTATISPESPSTPSQDMPQGSSTRPAEPVLQKPGEATATPKAQAASPPQRYNGADYPKEFLVTHHRPYLVVTECTQSGVTLSFDARFLKNLGFRLSMPVVCVMTGETDRTLLQARPLAFLDQSKGTLKNAYELEAGHEQKLIKGQSRKEMIDRMGVLADLMEPFRHPFPYYICQDHSSQSLKCYTTKHENGSTIAHVLIPEGPVAVQWLVRVNGVCGPEYDMLRDDVARLWQDVWLTLDEQVRRRLEVWTNFKPGEKFRYFINDADMRKKDEGLAGVVLTDRRLIYKKFHRQGQFEYGTNAKLVVRPDGQFAGLRVKTEDGTFKCAKFHLRDLEKLRDAAKDLGFYLDVSK